MIIVVLYTTWTVATGSLGYESFPAERGGEVVQGGVFAFELAGLTFGQVGLAGVGQGFPQVGQQLGCFTVGICRALGDKPFGFTQERRRVGGHVGQQFGTLPGGFGGGKLYFHGGDASKFKAIL